MLLSKQLYMYLLILLLSLIASSAIANIPLSCDNNSASQYLNSPIAKTCPNAHQVCYDIVYIRYPIVGATSIFVNTPRGEKPYNFEAGADLMLLHPDGNEKILVDCDSSCSITDPFISYDGKTVYFVRVNSPVKIRNRAPYRSFYSHIYKMALSGENAFKPIQLTFNDGFDSLQYVGNKGFDDDLISQVGISDLAPVPLADGRLLFTSNRAAFIPFHPDTGGIGRSVQQMYTMDDHDGSAITAELANIKKLDNSNVHLVQHPHQLKDGRIIFSSWQDAGTKFIYAMTPLMTIKPDGSDLNQFTEPHEVQRMIEHFITQLSDGKVMATRYYPANNYGFGLMMRYDLNDDFAPSEPLFMRGNSGQLVIRDNPADVRLASDREFDRIGSVTITPYSAGGDSPAPEGTGKFSMPAATLNNGALVAFSTGSVNHFGAACDKKDSYRCDPLESGIYLIPNANSDTFITNNSQLIKIKDDPKYNEIFPKPVLNYYSIYGQTLPDNISPSTRDVRLKEGEANALIGTSSMYNRETSNTKNDPFNNTPQRGKHSGTWRTQGTDAGVYTNSDIYAVRIITTPAKPYTSPISKWSNRTDWDNIVHLLADKRLSTPVARFSSYHGERWEILGEFPLPHKLTTDLQGNPDTSWIAKIPAEIPTFIQAIDNKGMTLNSELTWRALKPGEKKVDCGGCHAHSTAPLDYETTESGIQAPIVDVKGIDNNDARIQSGLWDLTQNSIPLLAANNTVKFIDGYSYGVEFNRDIQPLFNAKCISCHTAQGSAPMLDLKTDTWKNISSISNPNGGNYTLPQRSKYIRVPQARQSLLVWVAWGERLDGRTNQDRDNDVDYPNSHPVLNLSDDEKRLIARWVDLGGPIDFPKTEGFGYTEDYHLPAVEIASPIAEHNPSDARIIVGFNDVHSGLNLSSLKLSYYPVPDVNDTGNTNINITSITATALDDKNTLNMAMPADLKTGSEYVLKIEIEDKAGNKGVDSRRFFIR